MFHNLYTLSCRSRPVVRHATHDPPAKQRLSPQRRNHIFRQCVGTSHEVNEHDDTLACALKTRDGDELASLRDRAKQEHEHNSVLKCVFVEDFPHSHATAKFTSIYVPPEVIDCHSHWKGSSPPARLDDDLDALSAALCALCEEEDEGDEDEEVGLPEEDDSGAEEEAEAGAAVEALGRLDGGAGKLSRASS